jgi:hypothetical protein
MRQQQLEQALKHIEAIVDNSTNQAVALLQIKGVLNQINVKGNGLYSTATPWQQDASIRRAQANGGNADV